MDTIEALLNDIEGEILRAKKSAFSATDVIVNRQNMLSLLTRFRAAFPVVLREAEQIKKERDEILEKATAYANDTMDKAEERARALMADSEIVKRATNEAAAIRSEAEKSYREMDYNARSVAFALLSEAENAAKKTIAAVAEHKRNLINN